MTPLAIVITPRALRHVQAAEAWWRQNRGDSPRIADAINRALETLLVNPQIGAPVHWKTRTAGLRRVILSSIGYHVYYRVNIRRARLEIVGFWHERRRPPRF